MASQQQGAAENGTQPWHDSVDVDVTNSHGPANGAAGSETGGFSTRVRVAAHKLFDSSRTGNAASVKLAETGVDPSAHSENWEHEIGPKPPAVVRAPDDLDSQEFDDDDEYKIAPRLSYSCLRHPIAFSRQHCRTRAEAAARFRAFWLRTRRRWGIALAVTLTLLLVFLGYRYVTRLQTSLKNTQATVTAILPVFNRYTLPDAQATQATGGSSKCDGVDCIDWCQSDTPLLTNCTLPVLIYAHSRPQYLQQALQSVADAAASGGTHAAVVVSLDGPESTSLAVALKWQAEQPDTSPARIIKILIHPPVERDPWPFHQLKLHWWWALDSVFSSANTAPGEVVADPTLGWVPQLVGYTGDILLLEEDIVITRDALVASRGLSTIKHAGAGAASEAWMYVLSNWALPYGKGRPTGAYILQSHGNLAYGFNASAWGLLKAAEPHFWAIRDGWDWSINHMQEVGCLPPNIVGPEVPRFRHIGVIGITQTTSSFAETGYDTIPVSGMSAGELSAGGGFTTIEDGTTPAEHPVTRPCHDCAACTMCGYGHRLFGACSGGGSHHHD